MADCGNVRNSLEITIIGMKRTGNHGIITWINHLFPDPVFFINNIRHFQDPFAKNHEFRRHKSSNAVNLHKEKYPDEVFSTEIREVYKKTLLMSYEDLHLPDLLGSPLIEDKEEKIGKSGRHIPILLLRDHYNIIASRMQMYHKEGSSVSAQRMMRDVNLWKIYAREFLQETSYLPKETVQISYNNWFSSEDYRKGIASRMGLDFTDAGLEIMPPQGSSFDDKKMDGKMQELKVLERWKLKLDDPVYREVISDPEAVELTEKIFGMSLNV